MVLKGGPMPARPSKVGLTVSNDARRGAMCAMRRPRRTAGAAPDGEQRQAGGDCPSRRRPCQKSIQRHASKQKRNGITCPEPGLHEYSHRRQGWRIPPASPISGAAFASHFQNFR
jgi:hypothetical protein